MNWETIHLPVTDSTNSYAKRILEQINHPTIIFADYQTKGRGQQNASWYSEPNKNLLCSIVLSIKIPANYNNYLSRWVSIILVDLLKKKNIHTDNIKIKWPNDILVKNNGYKKIAGILIENVIEKKYIIKTIIGIGFNINQTNFQQLQKTATSLSLITHQKYHITDIVNEMMDILNQYLPCIEYQQYSSINTQYITYLYGWQNDFLFKYANEIHKGKIIQLLDDGAISVQTQSFTKTFQNKEIEFLL